MKALRELSSLLAENAELRAEKVPMLASLCPSPEVLKQSVSSAKITGRNLNGILAIAQFLAESDGSTPHREQLFSIVLDFIRSIPSFAKGTFWPSSFSSEAAKEYFPELLGYVGRISSVDSGLSLEVSGTIAELVLRISAGGLGNVEGMLASSNGAKAFFSALGQNCPFLHLQDAEQVIHCLVEHWIQASFLDHGGHEKGTLYGMAVASTSSSSTSGAGSSPLMRTQQQQQQQGMTPTNGKQQRNSLPDVKAMKEAEVVEIQKGKVEDSEFTFASPDSTVSSSSPEFSPFSTPLELSGELTPLSKSGQLTGSRVAEDAIFDQLHSIPSSQSAYQGTPGFKMHQLRFEKESIISLERQEIAYRLLARILEKPDLGSTLSNLHVQQLRVYASKQLKSLLPLLKIRKNEWPSDVVELKTKLSKMIQVSQAATILQINCLHLLESDPKLLKVALRETVPLFMDVADTCNLSPWRRSKPCEGLFDSLVTGVAKVAAVHRGQLQRVLLRFKTIVRTACAQANTWGTTPGPFFESMIKGVSTLIQTGWTADKGAVESFLLALAAYVREKEKEDKARAHKYVMVKLNVVSFLADLSLSLDKSDVVELLLPLFVESLEEGEASVPSLLRLKLLEAVGRMACLGGEKSYREVVVLLTRSYLDKLSMVVGSNHSRTLPAEAMTERQETLPGAFVQIARGLRQTILRVDYRRRLLALCSDVGLIAETKNGRIGADLLGPLLPAVAEMCVDFDPTVEVEPSLLKQYRNLWFYIALFGLAPPLPKGQLFSSKSGNQGGILSHLSSGLSQAISGGLPSGVVSGFTSGSMTVQTNAGPYAWNPQWATAVEQIAEGTPPLVVASLKWLEDELELSALHKPGSQNRGHGNEKQVTAQRAALSAVLGSRVETSSISGVTATYLMAVAYLEVFRFKLSGGLIRSPSRGGTTSALSFAFKYLETPGLSPAILQCLVAIVHQAFNTSLLWLGDKGTNTGDEAKQRDEVITAHACFLIRIGSHREEFIRELADGFLTRLKTTFPQVLWNSNCLEALLSLVADSSPPAQVPDPGALSLRSISHQKVRDWISQALLLVPCTMQGLLQEQLRRLNRWQSATSDLLSVLSELRMVAPTSNETFGMACIPAVTEASAAAAGVDPQLVQTGSMEVLSTGIISTNMKSNYSGEIVGMKRFYCGMGGLTIGSPYMQAGMGARRRMSFNGSDERNDQQHSAVNNHVQDKDLGLNEMLTVRFVQQLQQFVVAAERGIEIDSVVFREACLRSAALLLSDMEDSKEVPEGSYHLLRLLCWCPAHIFTLEAMETGLFVWTWILSAAPQLDSRVLAELVDAWLWTVDSKKGLFASGVTYSGPAAKLRPQLAPGVPEPDPQPDPVVGIRAHRLWLGFFLDRYEAIRHSSSDQLLLFSRLLQGSICRPSHFSSHPAATGSFFTLLLFGLKFSLSQTHLSPFFGKGGEFLMEDYVYRAGLSWFAGEPAWYDTNMEGVAQAEANSVSRFLHHLSLDHTDGTAKESAGKRNQCNGVVHSESKKKHDRPSFVKVRHDVAGRDKRKQLLFMLCQSEVERLETWANPLKESLPRWRVGGDQWVEYMKTAWSTDPRISMGLVARFPGVNMLKAEVSSLVQSNIQDLFEIPDAVHYIVTPKAVEEDSNVLEKLPYWAPCSITSALEFLTPPYKGHHRVLAYVLRVLETYPPERVTFFMPQLVQSLRYDLAGLVEGYLMVAAQQSSLFAHILIWQLQGEEPPTSEDRETEKESTAAKNNLYDIVPRVKQRIIDSFTPEALEEFEKEFRFFDKVTSISGVLYPIPKDERRAGIRRELEKIEVEGDELYLPTDPSKLVRGIKLDSGIPLQSAAKVPIMISFEVVEKDGDLQDITSQACIFKVGDDCRQDVLALQVIALLRDIFEAVNLNLYLFPYGVLPTGYGRGIIEVVPNTRSRNQMGEITDGGLYEIFQQEYGPVGSAKFEKARDNFIISSAGYAVASLLLQPKDRHNGNLLFDSSGRLVHIDFGFILETSPGGNLRFESAQFKLSHEMTQLLDPSASMKSEQWHRFVSLCVKGYLSARDHMDGIVRTVSLMVDSGLPCFGRGDPIGNLRKRFHPEMTEREAANFMIKTCNDAYNKWSTAGYDLIQYLQQGIEM
ncbi:unnamed protein product [Calypogeia fissa]